MSVLVVTWSDSNCPFALALPTERTEAVLHGLVEAFAFFGCVPRELWWDNPKTVVVRIGMGRDRTPHPRYAARASHDTFAPRFCMPASREVKRRPKSDWWMTKPRAERRDDLLANKGSE
ncbi:hypothetical protein R5W23_006407 [Gemmata sp. JC673]|uniref:Transposase n=1 Tax=Gemmata algarum TaxID=2975278 RepID=A0ABU5EVL0_9BACT|nr:hypothetical protein [Gemmata algarum]MDY3559190.1 hypothetical protein [Gemmata algarum]